MKFTLTVSTGIRKERISHAKTKYTEQQKLRWAGLLCIVQLVNHEPKYQSNVRTSA